MQTVFLLWDNSRAEHGEGADLVDVYATRQLARGPIEDADEDRSFDFQIDEREIQGSQLLSDFTAKEIIILVKALNTMGQKTHMTMNDKGELTFIENLPEFESMVEKIGKATERPDVKKLLDEEYTPHEPEGN